MTTRDAGVGDFPALRDLCDHLLLYDDYAYLLRTWMTEDGAWTRVWEREGQVLGFAHAMPARIGGAWWLDWRLLSVAPIVRRNGVATALFEDMRRIVRARGLDGIVATVASDNHVGREALRSFGFVPMGTPLELLYPTGQRAELLRWCPTSG